MEKLSSADGLQKVGQDIAKADQERRKRILIVDDSLTVRELQRKLLEHHGYQVDVAVDGMDGWNALRQTRFDLVVSDVDMPRLDGVELVRRIRQDPSMRELPVMILSYKDREDDRQRGLEAGADYYLTKGSFQSEALVEAVIDLIGEAATT
jgi:two-component system sensor histidine kinase and response regulator WspE